MSQNLCQILVSKILLLSFFLFFFAIFYFYVSFRNLSQDKNKYTKEVIAM